MTYQEYGELVGRSQACISKSMNKPKGQLKASIANQLSSGGFLTPYEWKYFTPLQRLRRWKKWVSKLDDQALNISDFQQRTGRAVSN